MDGIPGLDLWDLIVTILHGAKECAKQFPTKRRQSFLSSRSSPPGIGGEDFCSAAILDVFVDSVFTATELTALISWLVDASPFFPCHLACCFSLAQSPPTKNASQMAAAATVMDGKARLPGCAGQTATKLACILEADESTRMRMGNSVPSNHEDHIAGKGDNSLQHYNLVHKFIPMPQAMKIPAAKAAVDKEWEKLEKISAWNLTKVKKVRNR